MGDVTSFLKWAGGKPWMDETHAHRFPDPAPGCVYRERFLGGGSVYFRHYAGRCPAVLSDANGRLIATYLAARDHVEDLIVELKRHPFEPVHYYAMRHRLNTEPDAPLVERAAWFMMINKYGFNGMYRENRKGECNIPIGRHRNPKLCNERVLRAASAALQGVEIRHLGFDSPLHDPQAGDVEFFDPPYVPTSKTANFTGYVAGGFGPKEQAALVAELHRLDKIGVRWVLTNSDTVESRALYAGWKIEGVLAPRSISCKGKGRGMVKEIVVSNWDMASARAA